jgi:hypothetical protein
VLDEQAPAICDMNQKRPKRAGVEQAPNLCNLHALTIGPDSKSDKPKPAQPVAKNSKGTKRFRVIVGTRLSESLVFFGRFSLRSLRLKIRVHP